MNKKVLNIKLILLIVSFYPNIQQKNFVDK